MKFSATLSFLLFTFITAMAIIGETGCAQIGAPTGGDRDSLAPKLVMANPDINTTNFSGNKITISFNEYIEVKDIQNNLLVSPFPKVNPDVSFKLKTVTVKIKDTLHPNTTYSINFGNAIVDVHEGNPYKNLTYVFSTGNTIDSLSITGNVILAETGKIDSTMLVLLYRNSPDSAVQKRKPDYIAKLNGTGKFTFRNLPADTFKLYALKDGDGSKTYNSAIETFAFLNKEVVTSDSVQPVTLFAYAAAKDKKPVVATQPSGKGKTKADKKLKYTTSVQGIQDLLSGITIEFSNTLKDFDANQIALTDTFFNKIIGTAITIDSTRKKVVLNSTWKPGTDYRLIINKEGFSDSADNNLATTDTIRFKTKKDNEYGAILLRFININN
ncbi:MAG: Ig-like domain-containing protein [Sphingobacteriales bacterium]|nr:Ig-like domain-containing protein [Sphingobacteriales bacterium]